MIRGLPLRRFTRMRRPERPLPRSTILLPRTRPMPVSRPKSTPNDVRQLVLERDEHACYRCGTSGDLVTNHRYGGMGGRREQAPADLCTLCALCNGWCEDNLRAAYVAGWRIRRGALSGHQVPLRDSLNREWRLHVDGTRTRQHAPLPEAAA